MTETNNMKLHNPLFSIIVILIQLILSIKDYFELQEWKKANPEFDSLISLVIHYDTLFLFVLIIGIYEMLTKPSRFKTLIRIFLVCIVLGTEFSGLVPIEGFKSVVYNTAWFSAVVSVVLILAQIGKTTNRKLSKT